MSPSLVGVSLKAHLSLAETMGWLNDLRGSLARPPIDMFVCPSSPLLERAVETLADTAIAVGSQDVSMFGPGPHTGEVPAAMVADLGARYAEVGHAERRKELGETDADVALKVERCLEVGLTPIICVGEENRLALAEAVHFTCGQLDRRLAFAPAKSSVVVAYEPEWAIGAARPASSRLICNMVAALRAVLRVHGARGSILYGGSAAEGVYGALCDAALEELGIPDGLFIGRAALDVGRLRGIVDEVSARSGAHAC